jgi:hypothetical protein
MRPDDRRAAARKAALGVCDSLPDHGPSQPASKAAMQFMESDDYRSVVKFFDTVSEEP